MTELKVDNYAWHKDYGIVLLMDQDEYSRQWLVNDDMGCSFWVSQKELQPAIDCKPTTGKDVFKGPTTGNDVFKGWVPVETTQPEPTRTRVLQTTSENRKEYPMARGLLDYFPDALAEVSKVSYLGNQKHNPGQDMHHSRGKSSDHADCIMRHLAGRGGFDGGVRESAALAWRALALLQEELEAQLHLPLPRGAKAA